MGEGESLWSLIICDHQMEQVDMPELVCKQRNNQAGRSKQS
jgi:hypothetical protein